MTKVASEPVWNSWIREYRASRYLREVEAVALEQRLDYLKSNLWSTDFAGNVVQITDQNLRSDLLRLICHVLVEKNERAIVDSIDFDERAFRESSSSSYKIPNLKKPITGASNCLSKFGTRVNIEAAWNKGILRIAPASSYDDPSLNSAQTDQELTHVAISPNEHLEFKVIGLDDSGNETEVPVIKKELFRYMEVPDFYVWCCGVGYDVRLFQEFQAEAALVIKDRDEFRIRLEAALSDKIPEGQLHHGRLEYYDPYSVQHQQLKPIFSKNFKYLYQNEYRFALVVPAGTTLSAFFVELGSLHGIAEYVEIV